MTLFTRGHGLHIILSNNFINPIMSTSLSLEQEITLLDLLDRVLDKGIVVRGELTLSVAEIDLVHVSLRALISSVETARKMNLVHESERVLLP